MGNTSLFDQANAPTGDDGDAMIEALSSAIADHPSLLCADGAPFRHIFAVQDCAGTARTAAGTEPHLRWDCALWHAAPADGDDTERASLRLKCAAAGLPLAPARLRRVWRLRLPPARVTSEDTVSR